MSSYYEASHDEEALALAKQLFSLIEEKCTDEVGYLEAFTREFQPESNEKLSENGVLADKTMNTLLHVFEAYTELYRVSRDETVGSASVGSWMCLQRKYTIRRSETGSVFRCRVSHDFRSAFLRA